MKFIFLLIFLFFFSSLIAQSPYEISWKKESFYLGLGAGLYGTSGVLEFKYISPLTELEIIELDRASVISIDRNATFYFSSKAKNRSNYVKLSSFVYPFLFLSHQHTRKDFGKIMALYGETLLIVGGITCLSKRVFLRPRPLVFNELVPMKLKQKNNARYAFFSGHASISAANSIFAAKVFSDYFPESKWKPVVWGSAILVPMTTGYLRVKAGKHYPSDIIAGIVIGGAIGFFLPHLHRKRNWNGVSIKPSLSGFHLSLTF